ncbi:DUF2283 domain-containing protein [Agromyces sp. S2-1-8]|uniref:DUF2283 domain-containing protein n=1 Tax=Agromyces sp. S2-1-8 TaxID=2897180 RepID=UPI0035ABA315
MKFQYDPEVDAAYLQLVEHIADGDVDHSVEGRLHESDVALDYRADGTLIGIEILEASKVFTREVLNGSLEA